MCYINYCAQFSFSLVLKYYIVGFQIQKFTIILLFIVYVLYSTPFPLSEFSDYLLTLFYIYAIVKLHFLFPKFTAWYPHNEHYKHYVSYHIDGKPCRLENSIMRQPENMCYVRNSVVKNIGKKVKVRSYRGRNKVDVAEGVISATYPCVFLIELEGNTPDSLKTMTFSYTDVLTKEVELVLC